MLRLQLKRLAVLAGLSLLVSGAAVLKAKSFLDPRLSDTGSELQMSGHAFTGFLFEKHKSGSLSRLAFIWNGKRLWKEWHWYADGILLAERDYDRGRPHGFFRTWHPNGRPQSIKAYKDGFEEGEYWSWNTQGQVVEYRRIEGGEEKAYKSFTYDNKVYYNYVNHAGERIGVQAGEFCKSKRKSPN